MSTTEKICYNCFGKLEEEQQYCPLCGYDLQSDIGKYPTALPYGSILNGCYIIGRVLGQGGFGITYKAQEWNTKKIVAIKEYLPDTLANRTEGTMVSAYSDKRTESFEYGKKCFLEEARTLAEFIGNSNIVRVYSYFEENGTAYFVMDYIEGQSFQEYIDKQGGRIPWQEAEKILFPAIEALSIVHDKGIIHRDMTPDNIYITTDHEIKLLDFGSARYSWGNQSQSLDIILKHGYAPIEQYSRHGRQGPYTDIYSVAACFYFSITGRIPPDSIDRPADDHLIPPSSLGINIPVPIEEAILKGLNVYAADRFPNMQTFKKALQSEESKKNNAIVRKTNKRLFLVFAAACMVICVFSFLMLRDEKMSKPEGADTSTKVAKTKTSENIRTMPENIVTAPTESRETAFQSVVGNTFGNLNNGGIAVEDNDFIYIALPDDGIEKLNKADGSMKCLKEEKDVKELNLYEEWIYYLNTKGAIYVIKTDGSGHKKLLENRALSKFHIGDDYLYYCLENEEHSYSLYRTELEHPGTELYSSELLVSRMSESYLVDKNWIYYWSMENGRFYRVRADGTELTMLSDISGKGAAIADDWIYVMNPGGLYRIKADGSDQEMIYEDTEIKGINVQDDTLFFITGKYNDEYSLCQLKLDGNEINIVYSVDKERESLSDINVVGDYIVFNCFEEDASRSVGILNLEDATGDIRE